MKTSVKGSIESNIPFGKETFHCKILLPNFNTPILPGQFVQISCPGKNSTFLKRPISVFNYEPNYLELIYKVVGSGTENLSVLQKGQSVDVILPLGNSYSPPPDDGKVLMIAGGIGIAPIHYYYKYYQHKLPATDFTLLYGVTSLEEKLSLVIPDPFPGTVLFHADIKDGVNHGNLLEFFKKQPLVKYDLAIICGPTVMMKAFSDFLSDSNGKLEVSLESNMACGYGVCLGCSFPTWYGSKTVCNDGPVFNSGDLDWNKIWKN